MKSVFKAIGNFVMIVLILGSQYGSVLAHPRLLKYMNPRFGFSIEYPDLFTDKKFSDNGDGISLTNKERGLQLIVYGSNNSDGQTPKSAYRQMLEQTQKVKLSVQRGNWYLVGWEEEELSFITKVVVGEGSLNGFRLSYPTKDEEIYNQMIYTLCNSFRTPSIYEMR